MYERRTHPLASRRSVPLASLPEHAYVSRELGSGTREVIDHYLRKAGLSADALQVVMEASSPEALKGLVATGLGYAIMSSVTVEKEVRLRELVQIPLEPRLLRRLAVVYPKERFHSKAVSGFVRFAKERLGATRSAEARFAAD